MSESLHLFRLQVVDRQLDQIYKRSMEIDQLISNNSDLKRKESDLKEIDNNRLRKVKEIQLDEDLIASKKIKSEQSESSLYGGKVVNPKELQDLQVEIGSLKKNISQIEEDLLTKMVELEKIELQQKNTIQDLENFKARSSEKNAGLLGEKTSNLAKIEKLLNEKKVIVEQINPEHVKIYETLRSKKNGIAVSEIIDKECNICGSEVTPAEWQATRSSNTLVFCSSCGRILYAA